MDLTPKNHCWWPMFNCCRPPTVPTSSDEDEQDTDEYFHNEYLFSISPPLKITTTSGKDGVGDEVAVNLDTPTTACTDRSADVSFSSSEDGFIGVIALASPESTISTRRKRKITFQGLDSLEVMVSSTPQDCNADISSNKLVRDNDDNDEADDVSDPDEANYWYSALSTSFDGNQNELDSDDIPEISDTYDNTFHDSIVTRNDANSLSKDQAEIKFYQLMVLMMLRHVLGSWLPGELDPWQHIFKAQLLQAQYGGGGSGKKRKGFRTMMKRKLHFTDKKFEVVPQLQREDDIAE